MKKLFLLIVVAGLCFAYLPPQINRDDAEPAGKHPLAPQTDRVLISSVGDIRALLGPQGKNICVSANGDAIAVIYGDPTSDPDNYMQIMVAYSYDDGATWTEYGPFSPFMRRIYPGIDGSPDFDVNPGELYFCWQESPMGYATGDIKVMIEENVPSSPSFSSPVSLPGSSGSSMTPWYGNVAVAPDDPFSLSAIAFSYLNNGDNHHYSWTSDDGGYTWVGPVDAGIAIDPVSGSSGAGIVCRGTGGYAHITLHDTIDAGGTPIAFPKYVESTDGGATWSQKHNLPVPVYADTSNFRWHELDIVIANDEIWNVHTDLNLDHMWVFHGTGGYGAWTWNVFDVRQLGAVDTTIGDTLYYSQPSQYPSIAYDDASGMVLVTYKANYIKVYIPTSDTIYNGAHVGGCYTLNDGATWVVADAMSQPNTGEIVWANWNGTETAHRIVDGCAYTVWVDEIALNVYFERYPVQPYTGVMEYNNDVISYGFGVKPNITNSRSFATFTMPQSGPVSLNLYDASGRLVNKVFEGYLSQGNQRFEINTSNLASGTYFAVLDTDKGVGTQKLIKLY